MRVPRETGNRKLRGSNPFAPTVFREKPFGENVEGLSHCGDKSYAIETGVQKHDFEQSTLRDIIGGKPLLFKSLREFKNFRRQLGCFIVRSVQHVELKL